METTEAVARFHAAVVEVKAEYNALTLTQRRAPAARVRSERVRRLRSERGMYVMQGKVHIHRLGLTATEARTLDETVFAFHADRHRILEAVSLR